MDKTTLREGTDEIVLEETLRDRAEGSRRGEGAVRSGLCRRVRAFAVQPEPARGPQARESRDRVLHEVPRGGQRREGTGDVPETPRGGAPPPPHDRGGDRGAQEAGVLELSTPFHKYGCIRAPLQGAGPRKGFVASQGGPFAYGGQAR